jgi:hypothetical protein
MKTLSALQVDLAQHPLFAELTDLQRVRLFMESHVWAVWDFMSLLKRLQRDITCVDVPWKPSAYSPAMVRFINQIVVGEESDVDEEGTPISHFQLYLAAMKEVGADTAPVEAFLEDFNLARLPAHAREFTTQTLHTALHGDTVEVAASFFYGREKAIPSMFQGMVDVLRNSQVHCPKLMYYLERHIHVDGEEHGPLSEQCLTELCGNDVEKLELAERAGLSALRARQKFWNGTLATLESGSHAAL